MRHYWSIYKEFLRTCLAEASSFRAHFFLTMIMDCVFYFTSLFGVYIIFQHVDHIGPWNQNQFLFFMAFMLAVDHLHMTFISENFWGFSEDLRMGKLDFLLIKPAGALFSIFFRHIRASTMLNAFVPATVLIIFGRRLGFNFGQWLSLPFLVLYATVFITSLEILISMSMFWIIQSDAINFLRMQFQQLARWPDFIYRYGFRKVFTFVFPILMVGSYPVHFLYDQHLYKPLLLSTVFLVIIWILIGYFWRLGLRHYESASS